MAKFKPRSWSVDAVDLEKEYNEWDAVENAPAEIQTEPEEFSKAQVRKGLLNPENGEFGLGSSCSKQEKIRMDNARGYSRQGKCNYERIFGHA